MDGYLFQTDEITTKIVDTHRIGLEKQIGEILASNDSQVEHLLALIQEMTGIGYHTGYTTAHDKQGLKIRKLRAALNQKEIEA